MRIGTRVRVLEGDYTLPGVIVGRDYLHADTHEQGWNVRLETGEIEIFKDNEVFLEHQYTLREARVIVATHPRYWKVGWANVGDGVHRWLCLLFVGFMMRIPHRAPCSCCGAAVDTREVDEGGGPDGAQLSNGEWVCSSECWDLRVMQLEQDNDND